LPVLDGAGLRPPAWAELEGRMASGDQWSRAASACVPSWRVAWPSALDGAGPYGCHGGVRLRQRVSSHDGELGVVGKDGSTKKKDCRPCSTKTAGHDTGNGDGDEQQGQGRRRRRGRTDSHKAISYTCNMFGVLGLDGPPSPNRMAS